MPRNTDLTPSNLYSKETSAHPFLSCEKSYVESHEQERLVRVAKVAVRVADDPSTATPKNIVPTRTFSSRVAEVAILSTSWRNFESVGKQNGGKYIISTKNIHKRKIPKKNSFYCYLCYPKSETADRAVLYAGSSSSKLCYLDCYPLLPSITRESNRKISKRIVTKPHRVLPWG